MSDTAVPQSAHPGSLSPRDIDTRTWTVLRPLPRPELGWAPGATFRAWPQGEKWACVSGWGLGVVTNSEILAWFAAGLIAPAADAAEPAAIGVAGGAGREATADG